MTPFRIKQLDHIVLRVRDIDVMMSFYVDVLGCTVEKTNEEIGLYQLRAGSGLIDLVPVDSTLGREGGNAPLAGLHNLDHFCLSVEPFDGEELRSWLIEHGVDAGEVASRYGADGQGPSVYLHDPEGNMLELKGPASD